MSKRILCLILSAVMVFSLLPVFASAAGEDATQVAAAKSYSDPGWTESGGMATRKTLTPDENGNYTITMEAYAEGETVSQLVEYGFPLDIAIVVDQSGSMMDSMPTGYDDGTTQTWTADQIAAGNYYVKDEATGSYYKVNAVAENGASSWRTVNLLVPPELFNDPDLDYTSTNSSGTSHIVYFHPTGYYYNYNGSAHQIYANYFKQGTSSNADYYAILYFFKDESDADSITKDQLIHGSGNSAGTATSNGYSAVNGYKQFYDLFSSNNTNNRKIVFLNRYYNNSTNATANTLSFNSNSYSFFYDTDASLDGENCETVASLYQRNFNASYVDSSNVTHTLISNANETWSGTLYQTTSAPRYLALQQAVKDFCQTVADKSQQIGVDHKIALIGFAGNEVPATSTVNGVYHSTPGGYNRSYDYVNTGLFINNTFKNYYTITGYTQASTKYTNAHYYLGTGNNKEPIVYSSSSGYWKYVSTGNRASYDNDPGYNSSGYSQTYYTANYAALQPSDYQAALVSASTGANGTYADGSAKASLNTSLTNSIAQFGCYGGTYISYGMAMANQVFAINTEKRADTSGAMVDPMKVIIVFTDGVPGGSGYEPTIAGEAIADAAVFKSTYAEGKVQFPGQIYTLGLYSSTPAPDSNEATFMTQLSSNSNATAENVAWENLNPTETYYYTDNNEHKTYSVTCNGQGTLYLWEGHETYYTLSNVQSTIYTSETGNTSVNKNNVKRGTTYYLGSNRTEVYCDYMWLDSNGYSAHACYEGQSQGNGYWQFFRIASNSSGDATGYYWTVQDAYGLSERFNAIASNISVPTTTVTLDDENSFLRDIITDQFDVDTSSISNVSVSIERGHVDSDGADPGWTAVTDENKTNDDTAILNALDAEWENGGKSLKVTGFDYGTNYVGYEHDGYKLVVTITGLKPNQSGTIYSNTAASGIYKVEEDESSSVVAPFTNPYITIDEEYKVLDFSAKSLLSNAAYNYNEKSEDKHGGSFAYESAEQKLFFTPAFAFGTDGKADISAFSETSSALYFSKAADPAWKKVNVVPANNVYFDDDLTAQQNTLNRGDNGYGYLSDSLTNVNQVTNVKKTDAVNTREITFHGKRLDVYFQSDQTVNNVSVTLKDAQGDAAMGTINGNANASRLDSVIVHKTEDQTMVNVPVISVVFDEVNTYTVVLSAKTANGFRIDGVRVYGAADETDETVSTAYTADGELNADFTRVRELLLSAASFNSITENSPVNGVLFVDKQNGVTDKAEYQKDGPKNEVYLSAGQGVAFNVEGYENKKISVGLRSAESGAPASAEVSNGAGKTTYTSIKSIDIYYSLTPDAHGNVYIKNTSGGILAVTNIKVTDAPEIETPEIIDGQSKKVEFFATAKTMEYVLSFDQLENVTVEPSPEPTQQPSIVDLIHQLLSAFVTRLFSSIGRLFGN